MDILFLKSGLTEDQQTFIKGKESFAPDLLAASEEILRRKEIPEEIIKPFLAGRKGLSLDDCLNVWKKSFGKLS